MSDISMKDIWDAIEKEDNGKKLNPGEFTIYQYMQDHPDSSFHHVRTVLRRMVKEGRMSSRLVCIKGKMTAVYKLVNNEKS